MSIERIHTSDGSDLAAISPVVEKLIVKGVITRSVIDGLLTDLTKERLRQEIADIGVCDFCDNPQAPHVIQVPDFEMPAGVGKSLGDWAACDKCYSLIQENKRAELLRHAIDSAHVGKFGAAGIRTLHESFWKAREDMVSAAGAAVAFLDFIDGKIPLKNEPKTPRLDIVRKITGLTDDEITAMRQGDFSYKNVAKKMIAIDKKFTSADVVRRLVDQIEQEQIRPLPPGSIPHWQQALDAKFAVATQLGSVMAASRKMVSFTDSLDPNDAKAWLSMSKRAQSLNDLNEMGFNEDIKMLRVAEVYSFNADTERAIMEAAKSIPHDSPLSSIETPNTGAGWFWFSQPLPVTASPLASDETQALLWAWTQHTKETPAILFSAYVKAEKNPQDFPHSFPNKILPSTRWYWPLGMSFHDMLAFNTIRWRESYGPGAKFEHATNVMGEEATLKCIADLSMFFLAACVWFKQKVLVSAPGHIERHAKKRYVKEHQLKEPPSVRVIALRESLKERTDSGVEPGVKEGTRTYGCRWIVRGHMRLQVCGPGRADRKLIFISPYPKGDPSKPLRTREKVFAVIR